MTSFLGSLFGPAAVFCAAAAFGFAAVFAWALN
jgi:hypothetical protein